MKNSHSIWLSIAFVAVLAIGNTLYAKKALTPFSAKPATETACKKLKRWLAQGTFTRNAGAKYLEYSDLLEQCRTKYPELMESEDEHGSADELDEAALAAKKRCLTYRVWDIKKKVPARITDAKIMLTKCKKDYRVLFAKPKSSLCAKYKKWLDNGVFTRNGGDLFIAELCRQYK